MGTVTISNIVTTTDFYDYYSVAESYDTSLFSFSTNYLSSSYLIVDSYLKLTFSWR